MGQGITYDVVDDFTDLNASTWNPIMRDINSRIGSLESNQPNIDAAINNLTTIALARINSVLSPAFSKIQQIQSLGFLSAPAATGQLVAFQTGNNGLVVDPNYKDFFVPSPWLVIAREANATDYLIAQTTSYIAATGALSFVVTSAHGNPGTYPDAIVEGCPGGALAAIDSAAQVLSLAAQVSTNAATVAADTQIVIADTNLVNSIVLSGPVSSINGMTGAITGVEFTSDKGIADGYAGLDGSGVVPIEQLPSAVPNGLATLDAEGDLQPSQLPASATGCLQYQGTWNASSNTPPLVSSVGVTGQFYLVATAGSTLLNGNSSWMVGDALWFDGISNVWRRWSQPVTYPLPKSLGGTGSTIGAGASPIRQTILSGPVDSSGTSSALFPFSSGALSISTQNVSSSSPIVASAAEGAGSSGALDLTGASSVNLTWSGLAPNTTCYCYVTVNSNGSLTPSFTTLQPVYQPGGTPSTVSGQFTFNYGQMIGYLGNGTSAIQSPIVFVGECVTGAGTVTSAVAYAYSGYYDSGFTPTLPTFDVETLYNHNIGIPQVSMKLYLRCITADHGYSVGDILDGSSINGNAGIPPAVYSSRLIGGFTTSHSASPWLVCPKAGGTVAINLTAVNWSYAMRFIRNWAS